LRTASVERDLLRDEWTTWRKDLTEAVSPTSRYSMCSWIDKVGYRQLDLSNQYYEPYNVPSYMMQNQRRGEDELVEISQHA
jgi:hypothetical protein